jgi:hypothetical protein
MVDTSDRRIGSPSITSPTKGKTSINLAYHKNFKIHSTGAARGTNKTWTIGTSGRHVTKTGLQSFLLKQLGIERAHITSIALAKVPKPTAMEEEPHESDQHDAGEQTQIIKWDIIFAKPELCTLWSILTDKWVLTAIDQRPERLRPRSRCNTPTGWTVKVMAGQARGRYTGSGKG